MDRIIDAILAEVPTLMAASCLCADRREREQETSCMVDVDAIVAEVAMVTAAMAAALAAAPAELGSFYKYS
jgi:hypothetical protein